MINLIFPGTPIAKKRPRFARSGGSAITYDEQSELKNEMRFLVLNQIPPGYQPIGGAVCLTSTFFFERPKYHLGTGRNAGKVKPSAPYAHFVKPDVDNLLKFYMDVFNNLVYKDDCQVAFECSRKWYCEPGEGARTEIKIQELEKGGIS